MKSKKLMIFAICAVMALTAVGCGSKNSSSDAAPSAQQSSGQNNSSDNKDSSDNGEKAQDGENNSDEAKSDINTMDQLQDKVDEFNNTDDPERKEELRKELENFIRQAESDAVTASDE